MSRNSVVMVALVVIGLAQASGARAEGLACGGSTVELHELGITLNVPKDGKWLVDEHPRTEPGLDVIEWTAGPRRIRLMVMANVIDCDTYFGHFRGTRVHLVQPPAYAGPAWSRTSIQGPGGTVLCVDVGKPRPGFVSIVAFYKVTARTSRRTMSLLAELLSQVGDAAGTASPGGHGG